MTLTDKATIDAPGNVNTSQYGLNYTDKDENSYTPPTPDTPEDREKPDKTGDKDTATVYTYALAIQKVDENGDKLAGAVFKIQGLTATELKEGYYKVKSYDATSTADSIELKADKDGLLVIEGFSSSAELTVKEVVAPDGYNLLSKSVTMQAIKVGEEVKTTATTTEYKYKVDEDGNELPNTREVTKQDSIETRRVNYLDKNGKVVAYKETVNNVTKYYVMSGTTATEDTTEEHTNFNNAVNALAVTLGNNEASDSDVTVVSEKLSPKAIEVVNHKGTELPSTGGIGTTIFYVMGSILVICAGVVLVTRRRMSA
jgi:LPXTG-motif cell wall-anchored protein